MHRMASFANPANSLFIVESRSTWFADVGPWDIVNNWGDGGDSFAFWHSGGGNYIFVDGHVKFEKFVQTIADKQEDCQWGHPSPGDHQLHLQWRAKRAPAYQ